MGYATTRTLERVLAAVGKLAAPASVEFEAAADVAGGGVLAAIPALLAQGLLRRPPSYQLPQGFYGVDSIFLVLALMALGRIRSLEQLRYQAPGEWGKLLGLDRIPEVRTLREKVELLSKELGRAKEWNAQLAKEWMAQADSADLYFYCDGHVRVYHGEKTELPRHYVSRERLCLRATVDYWVNAMDGQPFLYINKEVDPGLVQTLKNDVVPWLQQLMPKTPEQEQRLARDPRAHWFTLVFDREGYSPELFAELFKKRIAILTYQKFPKEDWPIEQFATHRVELAGGQTVTVKLSERGARLSNDLWLREIRKLTDSGHQTAMLTTNFSTAMPRLAASMFARWCQENFFRYMREQYGLDRLVEYGTELIPDMTSVVNPQWRRLDSQIRSKIGQRQRHHAHFGALALSEGLSEEEVQTYERRKGELQEQIQHLDVEIEGLKQQRKETKHHIPLKSLPEEERFTRLRTERKHFLDTIKMIAYRAETSLVSILREHLSRSDDARTLIRQIFETDADLLPDATTNTLTVRIHHLTQAAHDQVLQKLCAALNETQTTFPGTDLTLIFKIGSSPFPPAQEV
jgi:hypothetical protein